MFDWVHYQFPSRVFFERDATHKMGTMVRDIGSRVMLVNIRGEMANRDEMAVIKTSLEKYTTGCIIYDDIAESSSQEELDTAAHFAKKSNVDVILAYGSRDSLNAGKAIALLCNNEVFAADLPNTTFPLKKAPLPVVTVPTSPSLGEESTPTFAVYNPENRTSFLATDTRLYPALIFIDPNITMNLSTTELARNGVAVVAACVESILSKRANEITNSIALRSLELMARNLPGLISEPGNHAARMNVSLASMLCGMAHSNSMLGLCYTVATAAHNLTRIDFFTAMAILLPHVMEYNLTTSANKYVQIAKALDEEINDITVIEAAIKAVEGVRKIYLELKVPQRLSDFEISKAELSAIASQAYSMPLTRNTPRELDRNEIETILIAAY